MRERTLETREPSWTANHFFIHVVHIPLGAVGHVAASELPPRRDRAQIHGTCGSAGAHLGKEERSRAEGHSLTPSLLLSSTPHLGPWDTWQHRSPP
jgi:hypothetical protein